MTDRKGNAKWAGGRVRDGVRGRVWVIEKMVRGRRYKHALKVNSEVEAEAELALFLRDPDGYTSEAARKPTVLTVELAGRFLDGQKRRGLSLSWRRNSRWALGWWAEELGPVDLRRLDAGRIRRGVAKHEAPMGKMVLAVLRAFCGWLVDRGELTAGENVAATVPFERAVKRRALEERGYTAEEIEAAYGALRSQLWRDILRVRVSTGMHASELARISAGECVVRPGSGEIAAVLVYGHKRGTPHQLSVDAETLAAVRRLMARKTHPDQSTSFKAFGRVNLKPARIRHTFVGLARMPGATPVYPPEGGGIPLSIVSQIAGHTSEAMTVDAYMGEVIPPMARLPLTLAHADDPRAGESEAEAGA